MKSQSPPMPAVIIVGQRPPRQNAPKAAIPSRTMPTASPARSAHRAAIPAQTVQGPVAARGVRPRARTEEARALQKALNRIIPSFLSHLACLD